MANPLTPGISARCWPKPETETFSPMTRSPGKTVIFITHEFFPRMGGIATFTLEMARAAQSQGHRVEVWAPRTNQPEDTKWPFPVERLPLKGTHDYACLYNISQEIITRRRTLRRACVYLPEPGPIAAMMYLQFFRAFRPRELILTFHGSEIIKFAQHPYRRFLLRRLLRHTSKVSCVSHYTRDLLLKSFPCAEDRVFLTPCALPSLWRKNLSPPNRQSQNSDSEKETLHLLTVGRLHPRKGQHYILDALARLPLALQQKVKYTLVGDGKRKGYKRKLREAAGQTATTVEFVGSVSDDTLQSIYRSADLFAMTSAPHWRSVEGFGLVYLEAASHGLPVLGHRIGGVPDAVIDGETGLLVTPDQPDELAAALQRLLEDRQLRQRLGSAGRERAAQTCWKPAAATLFGSD